ncbi:hypothetical protein [Clostridium sp. AM58-1XD]|uniref:hypothetical protein n=1 Tax=Clostridium sp. AM58-1XD TaxID=2292307 RepID=UPI000E494463|nr:hypothetical protein [Clostridium sp. AM58-1XD]RGY98897.1 hypothetical protein DXA13_09655 [Clostridium sp. AM58-1XD]
MLIISCATGTAVSKHFTSKLFARDSGKRKLEELRREIRDNMKQMIVEMQAKRELENWVHQRVEIRFNELTASMEEECEKMLNDTESTMDNIKKDLTRNELQRKQMAAECDEIVATVKQILENLKPLNMKVRQVLESA